MWWNYLQVLNFEWTQLSISIIPRFENVFTASTSALACAAVHHARTCTHDSPYRIRHLFAEIEFFFSGGLKIDCQKTAVIDSSSSSSSSSSTNSVCTTSNNNNDNKHYGRSMCLPAWSAPAAALTAANDGLNYLDWRWWWWRLFTDDQNNRRLHAVETLALPFFFSGVDDGTAQPEPTSQQPLSHHR